MRFNDLLRTVLANMGEGASAAVTRWRQCIDLLAQYDVSGAQSANALGDEERGIVLGMIEEMRPHISVEQRIASILELGTRLRSPGLVRLLSQDHPSLVAAIMANVRLTDADWAAIIPDLGPLARSVLRRRTDLEPLAAGALRQFGSIDLTLPSLVTFDPLDLAALETAVANDADAAHDPDEPSQIGRLVAQIERFTEERAHRQDDPDGEERPVLEAAEASEPVATAQAVPEAALEPEPALEPLPDLAPVNDFAFETDVSGLIRLVSGAPRSAAFGLSIAMPALDSREGADGMALGAFRRRAAFENARFTIGDGLLAGEWRMSADPRFDRGSGRFIGYVGSARREFPHESLVRAAPETQAAGWAAVSAASTRQLIHELRTPLNAIQGYAEMIDAQLMGPVSASYRDMAQKILADAHILLATFDDLDMASRIERGDHGARVEQLDLGQAIAAIIGGFEQSGDPRIDVQMEEGLPPIGGDRAQIERMLSHLIRAGSAALDEQERLAIYVLSDEPGTSIAIILQRPEALRALADADLLDHGYLVDQKLNDASPLGLAFTLKLVRGIATHLGGRFEIMPDAFHLLLPVAGEFGGEQENQR